MRYELKVEYTNNQATLQYEYLLIQLHDLIAEGKGDTEEADAVREAMELPERQLTLADLSLLNGLSADLYMLKDQEIFEPRNADETDIVINNATRVAWNLQEMFALLRLLRKQPSFLSREGLASLRSYAYDRLGLLRSSVRFKYLAARLSPNPTRHLFFLLPTVYELGEIEETERIARLILDDETEDAVSRFIALRHLYYTFSHEEQGIVAKVKTQIVPALRLLQPLLSDDWQIAAHTFLGDILALTGDTDAARIEYETALALNPGADYFTYINEGLRLLVAQPDSAAIISRRSQFERLPSPEPEEALFI